jgi:hypothetical protein
MRMRVLARERSKAREEYVTLGFEGAGVRYLGEDLE